MAKINLKDWPEQRSSSSRSHRAAESQNVFLKFRVIPTRRMHETEVISSLKRALRTGIAPAGIEIHWVDWESGREGQYNEGAVIDVEEMRVFYGAFRDATHVRAERA